MCVAQVQALLKDADADLAKPAPAAAAPGATNGAVPAAATTSGEPTISSATELQVFACRRGAPKTAMQCCS